MFIDFQLGHKNAPASQQQVNVSIQPDQETKQNREHPQEHIRIGQLLKSMIYGGTDGCSNMLVIILSGFSSGLSASKILAMAIAVCVGDGIVMGLGDYLSAKSEIGFIESQESREYYEVDNLLGDQKKEIVDIYTKKGFSVEESRRISDLYATNRKAFVNIMMLEELHLVLVDPVIAIKCGVVTFFSYIIFGVLPVLPYIVTSGIMNKDNQPWIASICIGSVVLFSLGFIKAVIIGQSKIKSGLEILIIGAAVTAIGYAIGFAFPEG